MTRNDEHVICEICNNGKGDTEKAPLLSIVTILRNPGELIKSNLSSFLLQEQKDHASSFEHLLVDGKSSDFSLLYVEEYARLARHPVRVYSQRDRGISHAFNIGLSQARGRWIWFLNADDLLYGSNVIENVLGQLSGLAADECMVAGSILVTDELLRKNHGAMVPKIGKVHMGMYLPHPALIASREVFNACGGFSESYKIGMDYEWLARVANHSLNFIGRTKITDYPFVMYRQSGISSISGDLIWKEFYAARLHVEGVLSASAKYFFIIGRQFLSKKVSAITRKNPPDLSASEQEWIGRVSKVSEELG